MNIYHAFSGPTPEIKTSMSIHEWHPVQPPSLPGYTVNLDIRVGEVRVDLRFNGAKTYAEAVEMAKEIRGKLTGWLPITV